METSSAPPQSNLTLLDLPAPEPHLPLRKASAQKLQQARRAAPTPLWANQQHQVRGFNPSPVQALPQLSSDSASSEHAFAGRDENRKKQFKPPLGVVAMKHGLQDGQRTQYAEGPSSSETENAAESRPPSSPLLPPPTPPHARQQKGLRSSKSLGGLKGWRHRFSAPSKGDASPVDRDTMYSMPVTRPSIVSIRTQDQVRDSYRSGVTSNSSFLHTSSINTEHSSLTRDSSQSDFVKVFPNWPETEAETEGEDEAVDDVIGMYVDGFESGKPSMDTQCKGSVQDGSRPTSQPSVQTSPKKAKRPNYAHRRSQSASIILGATNYETDDDNTAEQLQRSKTNDPNGKFTRILSAPVSSRPTDTQPAPSEVARDRYGFKKSSHYISVAQYDAWNATYSQHLLRRRTKWHALMNAYGLSTSQPYRFPPKSDKVKRYVRKGIPPEFRGAAWFWYAGGPSKMAKEPGLYFHVLQRVRGGELKENDREHIERDLQRTFPDNVKFKPDPTTTSDLQSGAGGGTQVNGVQNEGTKAKRKSVRRSVEPETPILQSLRRVLQAFAVQNPLIGYCQSLNFLAGLLLLFLDEDEEKSFILLNIITTQHLPGTHGMSLEGANIDIAVLISCVKDALPAVWAKLDDKGGSSVGPSAQALRLPTVSLATTAWFMSLFVGTLPIESVLRVWDCLFFEGSKTLFRIALAIFKFGEKFIMDVSDPMEIFQVVQTIPRSMLDINGLMEVCFRRRGGFGHVSQDLIERRREDRRQAVRDGVASVVEGKGWRARLRVRGRVPS